MRKLPLLLVIAVIALNSCDYLKRKGILGNEKEYIERLENTIKDDSLEFAAQMEKLKLESDKKMDSLRNACEKSGDFHVITGSFRNPLNAQSFQKEMEKQGYKAQIIEASNGFNLVSAFNGKSMTEVLDPLNNMRSSVNQEAWVFVK
jgi:uncharacterized protein YjgD (DUF1641 family)